MKYSAGINTHGEGWLSLHRNENLSLDAVVLEKLVVDAAKATSINIYPDTNCQDLKITLSKLHNVDPDNIFIGNGADEVLSSLFFLFRRKFDKINLPRICFKMYVSLAAKYGFEIHYFDNYPIINKEPSVNNSGFFVIDSPSSITGYVIGKETLSDLISSKENIIVYDNVYGEYCGDLIHNITDNLITVRHFSKFYGLAALRIGYCIASREVIKQLDVYREPFNVNSIALFAASACLRQHEYFASIAKDVMKDKAIFEESLTGMEFTVCKSLANFVLVKHKTLTSEFINKELNKKKIATRHFADDQFLKDYLRITIPPRNALEKVITTLGEIVKNGKETKS